MAVPSAHQPNGFDQIVETLKSAVSQTGLDGAEIIFGEALGSKQFATNLGPAGKFLIGFFLGEKITSWSVDPTVTIDGLYDNDMPDYETSTVNDFCKKIKRNAATAGNPFGVNPLSSAVHKYIDHIPAPFGIPAHPDAAKIFKPGHKEAYLPLPK